MCNLIFCYSTYKFLKSGHEFFLSHHLSSYRSTVLSLSCWRRRRLHKKINENRYAVPQNIYFAFSLLVVKVSMGPHVCVGTYETFRVCQHLRKCRQYETLVLCLTNVTELYNHHEYHRVVLGQVHGLFQCEWSGQCALVIFCEFLVTSRFLNAIH